MDHSAPLGPDAYGYYAYDNTDTDYPDTVPVYNWVTCSSAYGGTGTKLNLRNNETTLVELPFGFTFYGTSYDRMTISDNGWVSFETSGDYDYYNWHIPSVYGHKAKIAPFWDNLDPLKKRYGLGMGDGVYVLHDAENHRYVVEWSRIPNFYPTMDELQTFELILYDPDYRSTSTGDGIIEFQYKQIVNNDFERMFATVGIENELADIGLEYTYSNLYPVASSPLASGLAIRISTQEPRFDPPQLSSFAAQPSGSGVVLTWEPHDSRPREGYRVYRGKSGGDCALLPSSSLDASSRSFVDASANPDSSYTYRIGSIDPVGRETLLGPYVYPGRGAATQRLALEARTPNPFRGAIELTYMVPRRGPVELRVHDLSGRLVRTIVTGTMDAGLWNTRWDGLDESGHDLPSGVYLCRLTSGKESRSLKLTLLR